MPRLPSDWKPYSDGIRSVTLDFLQENKGQFRTLDEISTKLRQTHGFLESYRVILRLAFEHGLKGEITGAIHFWRGEGYPIISSAEKGKGYVLCDPNDIRTPEYWDDKLRANETQREQIPITERDTDRQLFNWCLEHCEDVKVRNLMIKIARKHNLSQNG